MIRVVIVDDERPARSKLRRYLEREPDVEIAGEAGGGREAVELIGRLAPDLVFLDIQMPDLDGFGVVAALGTPLPRLVFVTAHDQHALRAFEVHALDYLLKPVSPDRFERLLGRVREQIGRREQTDLDARLGRLLDGLEREPPPRYVERILVPTGERAAFLDVARLDRVEAARNYVVLHAEGRSYTMRGTIEGLFGRLDPAKFIRANRSEIVRIDAVREVQPWFHGEFRLVLADGTTVMWTRRFIDRASDTLLREL